MNNSPIEQDMIHGRVQRQMGVWVVPTVYIVLALIAGRVMPELDILIFPNQALFNAGTAVSLLSAITSGMITFTGFVFSMSFLLVQFGSSAYSPRLTHYFFQDPVVRHSLGVFTATFLYSLIALTVVEYGGSGSVSDLTVLVALLGVIASVFLFLALIQHVTVLQVTNVLHMVGDRGREVINQLYPNPLPPTTAPVTKPIEIITSTSSKYPRALPVELPPVSQIVHFRGNPLAILKFDIDTLVALAESVDGIIVLNYSVGDIIPFDATLLTVHGGRQPIRENSLNQALHTGHQRTIEQDPKYAIRLIVDIAIRALSPAINDPTTAVQALDQLDDLLRRIGTRQLDVGYAHDRAGKLRLIYPTPIWEDFIDLALHEIRLYGANSLQVMRRLRALLEDLNEVVPPERQVLVRDHLNRVAASIQRSFPDQEDRLDAQQEDRQGIGLSRLPDEETTE